MKRTFLVAKRMEKGLKQYELAELLGVASQTMCNFENGVRSPSGEMVYKISKILDFDMNDYYAEEEKRKNKIA